MKKVIKVSGGKKPKLVKGQKVLACDYADSGVDVSWFPEGESKHVIGKSCYESHPALKIGNGTFVGASCIHPREGHDIYIGLDWGMKRQAVTYPWNPASGSQIVEVYFPISDGSVPKDVVEFQRMIEWLAGQLDLGRSLHVGCIGGHGRTGLLLAALFSRVHGGTNAGVWVREHYCKRAIETEAQVRFLKEKYGIAEIAPAKGDWSSPMVEGYTRSVFTPVHGRSIWDSSYVIKQTAAT